MIGEICGVANGEQDKPIIPQIQKYAQDNALKLEPGWKVEIATQAKPHRLKDERL